MFELSQIDPVDRGPAVELGSVKMVELPQFGDDRGMLIPLEEGEHFLFPVRRVYYIFDTKPGIVRGHHAHKVLKQLLICVSGSCVVDVEIRPGDRASYVLDKPTVGLQVEGLVWREMRNFSEGAVLVVLADGLYDAADYVRDYDEFVALSERIA